MRLRRKRKSNNEVEEFDITSLLDILVILLVFLLKNFTDSELTLDIAKELALPYAFQRGVAQEGVIVQVNSKNIIYFNKKLLGSINSDKTLNDLAALLVAKAKELDKKLDEEKRDKPKLVNLVFDQSLQYESIDKILGLSAQSGFGKYKLIVQGDE